MVLVVCGVNEVHEHLASENFSAVLSIEHPNAEVEKGKAPDLSEHPVEQLILCFWDIEQERQANDATTANFPSTEVVREALEFLENNKHSNMIVHCKAGKARSVAIALAFLARENGISSAINTIEDMRPDAAPNIAIIRIADKILNMNSELVNAVESHKSFSENRARANERRAQQIERGVFAQDPEKAGPELI